MDAQLWLGRVTQKLTRQRFYGSFDVRIAGCSAASCPEARRATTRQHSVAVTQRENTILLANPSANSSEEKVCNEQSRNSTSTDIKRIKHPRNRSMTL
jgi:hypothetical protein